LRALEGLERTADGAIRLLGNRWFLATIIFFHLSSVVLVDPGADPDLFARVAVGRLVERDGAVSRSDPFAYTAKHERWVDHEWLAGVAFWETAKHGGDRGLILLALAGIAATVFLVAAAQLRFAGSVAGAGAWLVLCLAPLPWVWMSVVRSRILTYVLLPLFLLVLVDYRKRRDPRVLLVLPLMMTIWANWHGGFIIGLGFVGLTALLAVPTGWRFALPLWLASAACILVTLINPYGLDYWHYLHGALTMDRSWYIGEWKPLIHEERLVPWVAAAAIPWVALVVRRLGRRDLPAPEAIALPAIALLFAIDSNRLAAAFFVTVAVFGAAALEPLARIARDRAHRVPLSWRRSAALVAVP